MAVRRRVTRRAPVVRRRRRSMGAAFTKASTKAAAMTVAQGAIGGVAASFLTKMLSGTSTSANLAPYVGVLGAAATSIFLKQPGIAAGMAGYGGVQLAKEFLPDFASTNLAGYEIPGLSANYGPSSMYLQGGAPNSIYSSDYTLAGYDVPGM